MPLAAVMFGSVLAVKVYRMIPPRDLVEAAAELPHQMARLKKMGIDPYAIPRPVEAPENYARLTRLKNLVGKDEIEKLDALGEELQDDKVSPAQLEKDYLALKPLTAEIRKIYSEGWVGSTDPESADPMEGVLSRAVTAELARIRVAKNAREALKGFLDVMEIVDRAWPIGQVRNPVKNLVMKNSALRRMEPWIGSMDQGDLERFKSWVENYRVHFPLRPFLVWSASFTIRYYDRSIKELSALEKDKPPSERLYSFGCSLDAANAQSAKFFADLIEAYPQDPSDIKAIEAVNQRIREKYRDNRLAQSHCETYLRKPSRIRRFIGETNMVLQAIAVRESVLEGKTLSKLPLDGGLMEAPSSERPIEFRPSASGYTLTFGTADRPPKDIKIVIPKSH